MSAPAQDHDGTELWELADGIDADMGEGYCRENCREERQRGERCAACPAPPLWDENIPAVMAYSCCSTQWRVGMGGRTGLDYQGCQIALDARSNALVPSFRDALPKLQIIEHAMLSAEADIRERDRIRKELSRGT